MITSKWFRFIIAKIYNILRYVIPLILRHMCNLHTKETVILSVLSNKTNLILGFSSPLNTHFESSTCSLLLWRHLTGQVIITGLIVIYWNWCCCFAQLVLFTWITFNRQFANQKFANLFCMEHSLRWYKAN